MQKGLKSRPIRYVSNINLNVINSRGSPPLVGRYHAKSADDEKECDRLYF